MSSLSDTYRSADRAIGGMLHYLEKLFFFLDIQPHPGKFFNQQYIIADKPYTLKKDGLWKDGQYGYPHTIIYKDYMYVIISRLKESMEIIRFKIPAKK